MAEMLEGCLEYYVAEEETYASDLEEVASGEGRFIGEDWLTIDEYHTKEDFGNDPGNDEKFGDNDDVKTDNNTDVESFMVEEEIYVDHSSGTDDYSEISNDNNDELTDEVYFEEEVENNVNKNTDKNEKYAYDDLEVAINGSNPLEYNIVEKIKCVGDQSHGSCVDYDLKRISIDKNKSVMLKKSKISHVQFLRLFTRIVNESMLDFELCETAIGRSICHLNRVYRNVIKGAMIQEINFNNLNNCMGYLHRFASCHAALVYTVTSEILQSPPFVMYYDQQLTNSHQLNVVSVGGGPGNDLVGFLSALSCLDLEIKHLDITVIDKKLGWNDVYERTLQLLKTDLPGEVGRIVREVPNLTSTFFEEDLRNSKFWCDGMKCKLKNADIILMVKVLSHIPEKHKLPILKDVVVGMKTGALFIFIDCPIPSTQFSAISCMRNIYKSNVKQFRFHAKMKWFGHNNITECKAAVYMFVKV